MTTPTGKFPRKRTSTLTDLMSSILTNRFVAPSRPSVDFHLRRGFGKGMENGKSHSSRLALLQQLVGLDNLIELIYPG